MPKHKVSETEKVLKALLKEIIEEQDQVSRCRAQLIKDGNLAEAIEMGGTESSLEWVAHLIREYYLKPNEG